MGAGILIFDKAALVLFNSSKLINVRLTIVILIGIFLYFSTMFLFRIEEILNIINKIKKLSRNNMMSV